MTQGFTKSIPIDTDPNLTANSNFLVPSEAAVRAYVAAHGSGGAGGPTGTDTQIAYNNSGIETGDANLTWTYTSATLNIGNSSVNNSVNSTNYSGTANNALYLGGLVAASWANASAPVITTTLEVGAAGNNVILNTTAVAIGNSTVNASVNSTIYTGIALTANNATNLGGLAAASWANASAPVITTTLEVGAAGNNVTLNTTAIAVGNSTVNASVNSTIYTGQALTANNSTNLGGLSSLNYANTSTPLILTSATIGSSGGTSQVVTNTTAVFIGNSTVNNSINSTTYSGTANNATNFGGLSTANYANTSAPVFTTSIEIGNSTVNATANSTTLTVANLIVDTITSNSGMGIAGQVLTSGGTTTNAYWSTISSGVVGTNTQIIFNKSAVEAGDANLAWVFTNATLTVSNTIILGNSTVNTSVNSTVFTGTANNATNLGGLVSTSYANNINPVISTSMRVGSTANSCFLNATSIAIGNSTVNSIANSTAWTGSANNSTYLNNQLAAYYTNATNISTGTLPWAQAPGGTVNTSGAFTITGLQSFNANLAVNGAFFANGSNGGVGQVLTSAGTGNIYWSTVSSVYGTNTQIAFNNSGTETGDANLTWNTVTAELSVSNNIGVGANLDISNSSIAIVDTSNILINSSSITINSAMVPILGLAYAVGIGFAWP